MAKLDQFTFRSLATVAGIAAFGNAAEATPLVTTGNINLSLLSSGAATSFELYTGATDTGYGLTFPAGTSLVSSTNTPPLGQSTYGCSYSNSGDTNGCENDYIAWTLNSGTLTLAFRSSASQGFGIIAGQNNNVFTNLYINFTVTSPNNLRVNSASESMTVNAVHFNTTDKPDSSSAYVLEWLCAAGNSTCQNGTNGQGSAIGFVDPRLSNSNSGSGPWTSNTASATPSPSSSSVAVSLNVGANPAYGTHNNSAFNVESVTQSFSFGTVISGNGGGGPAIPEPATVTIFGAAAAGAAIGRRWRRKLARGTSNDNLLKQAA
jgi:hypothetical protein